ncbi:MAG TPA: hypothetical protein VNW72_06825 [Chthoniobacterales bacterium]|jgi:hypothetical protein|nr:hypothetical protein [Chthoniobacterales bacterium]
MKQTTLAKILAVACSMGVVTAMAQTSTTVTTKDAAAGTAVTETSTTTSTGTISTYTPGTDYITFRTSTDTAPVRYYYSKDTTILDPEGHAVTWSAVRPDLPATVYYARDGERMVVRKIVLSNPAAVIEKKETTTTTTTEKP